MDEQTAAAQQSDKSDAVLPPPEVAQPLNPETTEPATAQQLEKVEQQMSGFEKATLRWAKIAVIMSALAALFVCAQWYEMHAGGQDTHDLAAAAKDQAGKMKNMSEAADKIRQAADGMVTQDQRIADNAQQSLDASNKQSKAALTAAISQFRADQRAWVGLGAYRVDNFNDKDPFKLILPWVNSGKTPAIRTENAVAFALSPTRLSGPPDHKLMFDGASAIAPQGTYVSNITNFQVPLNFAAINDGTIWMYFFGKFRYHDVRSPEIHTTSFCLYYNTTIKQMSFCENGNDMD